MRMLLLVLLAATPLLGDVIVMPLPAERKISKFRLIMTTGEDDLRRNSAVSAFLILKDGRRVESKPLNCNRRQECSPFPARSRRTLEWTLDPKSAITADQIRRFGLSFKSGKNGPFDTGDNWDLRALEVEYVAHRRTYTLLDLKNRGGVHRFKTEDSWESDPIDR